MASSSCSTIIIVIVSLFFPLLVVSTNCNREEFDLTLVPGSTGCDVTRASLDKLVNNGPRDLGDDYLAKIAYLMTGFGERKLFESKHRKGLWMLNEDAVQSFKNLMQSRNNFSETGDLKNVDCQLEYFNLEQPLMSATIAAMLVKFGPPKNRPPQRDSPGFYDRNVQDANLWYYHIGKLKEEEISYSDFEAKFLELEQNYTYKNNCFKCVEKVNNKRDLMFIIGVKAENSKPDRSLTQDFIKNLVERYTFGRDHTRVAVIIYGDDLKIAHFLEIRNKRKFEERIKITPSGNMTDGYVRAIRLAKIMWELSAYGSRLHDDTVDKSIFFFTYSNLENSIAFQKEVQSLKEIPANIFVFCLEDCNLDNIGYLASSPAYAMQMRNDQLENNLPKVQMMICYSAQQTPLKLHWTEPQSFPLEVSDVFTPLQVCNLGSICEGDLLRFQIHLQKDENGKTESPTNYAMSINIEKGNLECYFGKWNAWPSKSVHSGDRQLLMSGENIMPIPDDRPSDFERSTWATLKYPGINTNQCTPVGLALGIQKVAKQSTTLSPPKKN